MGIYYFSDERPSLETSNLLFQVVREPITFVYF